MALVSPRISGKYVKSAAMVSSDMSLGIAIWMLAILDFLIGIFFPIVWFL
jgi:hypothetical protein